MYIWLAGCFFLLACSFSSNDATRTTIPEDNGLSEGKYTNPVIKISIPDPTVIRADDGYYYLYGTEDIRNIPIFRSRNMVQWTELGTAFTNKTRPINVDGASLWAPEIRYIKRKYVLFYSLAIWGQEWVSTIGYAIADEPQGPFTSKGVVFNSRDVGVQNSIDEFMFEENDKYYMFWGSFRGIYLMELDVTDDLVITPKLDTKKQVAGTAFEAVSIWKREKYYYLFASIGSCCEGASSTYTTVVGRSISLDGPYSTKEGRYMLDNDYTKVISRSTAFVGPGHNSILQEDDEGNTWIIYHAYRTSNINGGRQVMLDRIFWDKEGWPNINEGQPSLKADFPIID